MKKVMLFSIAAICTLFISALFTSCEDLPNKLTITAELPEMELPFEIPTIDLTSADTRAGEEKTYLIVQGLDLTRQLQNANIDPEMLSGLELLSVRFLFPKLEGKDLYPIEKLSVYAMKNNEKHVIAVANVDGKSNEIKFDIVSKDLYAIFNKSQVDLYAALIGKVPNVDRNIEVVAYIKAKASGKPFKK